MWSIRRCNKLSGIDIVSRKHIIIESIMIEGVLISSRNYETYHVIMKSVRCLDGVLINSCNDDEQEWETVIYGQECWSINVVINYVNSSNNKAIGRLY